VLEPKVPYAVVQTRNPGHLTHPGSTIAREIVRIHEKYGMRAKSSGYDKGQEVVRAKRRVCPHGLHCARNFEKTKVEVEESVWLKIAINAKVTIPVALPPCHRLTTL